MLANYNMLSSYRQTGYQKAEEQLHVAWSMFEAGLGSSWLLLWGCVQVKAWCYYESRLLGAHHGLISTYALETLVLYVFNKYHETIDSPLSVGCCWLVGRKAAGTLSGWTMPWMYSTAVKQLPLHRRLILSCTAWLTDHVGAVQLLGGVQQV